MKVAVDTHVLVRAVVRDDAAQARVAAKVYGLQTEDIAAAIRALLAAANVQVNRPAVEAGLSVFEANADFADGVIAYEGNWLGGEVFVSFDKQAVALLTAVGQPARLL